MIYLIASVCCSTLLVIILKLFPKYGVNTLHGIVVNYFTCVLFGALLHHVSIKQMQAAFTQDWIFPTIILGFLFIVIFNLSGISSQKIGISVTSMSMKLALVFPILFGFIFYHEKVILIKMVGIVLAIVAVVLSSLSAPKREQKHDNNKWLFLLPIIVFIGSGACDSLVQFTQKKYFTNGGFESFSIMLFLIASLAGLVFAVLMYVRNREKLSMRSMIGGLLLGVPNYLSLYFLLKVLVTTGWESTIVFPLANIGVVVTSAIVGILVFKEKLSKINVIGIVVAVFAIGLIIAATKV